MLSETTTGSEPGYPRPLWASCLRYAVAPLPALGLLPLAILGRALLRMAGLRETAERYSARIQRLWARSTLACFGVRRRSNGAPRGAALVAANHLSWLDILVLGAELDCRFVAKSEIRGWPVFGPLARTVGTLFVDRRRRRDAARVASEMGELLDAGVSVVQFAEGEVTRGRQVERFQPALFEPAAQRSLPCRPVALTYRTPRSAYAATHTIGWWGGVGLWSHALGVLRAGPVEADVRWAPESVEGPDRKRLAALAEAAVRSEFLPLDLGPLPPGDPRPPA
ncbi:MAG: lysophospholipid acyltransferase family protein [Planctomycetota bacterium]